MKSFLVLSLSFLSALCSVVYAEQRSAEAEQQHRLMVQYLQNRDYLSGVHAGEKELSALRQQSDKTDSLQANALVYLGVLNNRLGQSDKSIQLVEEAKDILLAAHLDTTHLMTLVYDNLTLYYSQANRLQKASEYSTKSVALCHLLGANDYDAGITLLRAADVAYQTERYKDAVKYESQALDIFANTQGMHSDVYIKELDFLAKCYRALRQEDEAKAAEALAKRLEGENKYGYIPMPADLSTAEKCRNHNEEAFYAAVYYRSHYFSADSMQYIANYLFQYSLNSADVHIFAGTEESKWMKHKFGTPYYIAYTAGFITYQLQNPEDEISYEAYKHGINALLQSYEANRQFSGKIKPLEKYISLYHKNKDKFFQKLEASYNEYLKAVEKTKAASSEASASSEEAKS